MSMLRSRPSQNPCRTPARAWRPEVIMSAVRETTDTVATLQGEKYKYGFVTDIEMKLAPKGLSEDVVRMISGKKNEPQWMLEWRLAAFQRWREMTEPNWARVHYPKI